MTARLREAFWHVVYFFAYDLCGRHDDRKGHHYYTRRQDTLC